MNVFIVTFEDYEDDWFDIEEVFSSEEKARKYIQDRINDSNPASRKYVKDCLTIQSYEVK